MSYQDELRAEPWRFDFFAVLRELERSNPDKPRIGNSARTAQDVVNIYQDPFVEFPGCNITDFQVAKGNVPQLRCRFLGFLGPQGALPLNTTIEAYEWSQRHDESFARFLDIFGNRFRQLFFRTWANARPIAQYDRPKEDRFFSYIASIAGIGSDAFFNRDSVDDIAKVGYAGLVGPRIKSPSRLKQIIRGIFDVDVRIYERIGSWLTFEPADTGKLGSRGSSLGLNTFLGQRVYSINEKIRISIRAQDLEQYRDYLPTGKLSEKLTDLIFFYLGHRYEFDVQLELPKRLAPAASLGQSGQLGWTGWMTPDSDAGDDEYLSDACFNPMEKRNAATATPN